MDVIYETASNLTTTGPHNGQPWLNSPAAIVSGSSATLNGVPTSGPNFATQVQLKRDYERKYRENFLPVNPGGQNSLQVLYASQGNYTLYDNHELGNRQYINGGAPAGGSVGGRPGTICLRAVVDARSARHGQPWNANDVNTSSGDYESVDWVSDASRRFPELPADLPESADSQRTFGSADGSLQAALLRPAVGRERDLHPHRHPVVPGPSPQVGRWQPG